MTKIKPLLPYFAIVAGYAFFRLMFLDVGIHIDEPHWLGRSLNFFRALATGEFEYTYQREHPGVLTMWAGAIAYLIRFPEAANLAGENVANPYGIASILRSWGQDPLEMMVAAKVSKVLLQTAFFAASLWFLTKVIDRRATLFAGALIAVSPTIIGWDSWLHLDGMTAITTFAAICAVAFAAEKTQLWTPVTRNAGLIWILAGAISATSWLTRITSLILIGVMLLALIVQVLIQRRDANNNPVPLGRRVRFAMLHGALWTFGALVATVALFPAMWVKPLEVIKDVVGLPIAGALGVGPPEFFPDQSRDPGWMYFPRELIHRTTPFEWMGIAALLLLGYIAWRRGLLAGSSIRVALLATFFAAVFLLGNSLSPKKYTRYMMSMYPIVILASSIGWVALTELIQRWQPSFSRAMSRLVLVLIVGYSLFGAVQSLPYKNIYFNPISSAVTGRGPALPLLPGQDQIAEFLMNEGEDRDLIVNVGNQRAAFEYFVVGPPVYLRSHDIDTPARWYESNFHLVPGQARTGPYASYEPVLLVEVDGRVVYEVYEGRVLPPPLELLGPNTCNWVFGERLKLIQVERGDDYVSLFFMSLGEDTVSIQFAPIGDVDSITEQISTYELTPQGTILRARFNLPSDLSDSDRAPFWFALSATSESGSTLPITSAWTDSESEYAVVPSTCFEVAVPEVIPGPDEVGGRPGIEVY